MNNNESDIDKELFIQKFEKLSSQVEKLTDEITKMKNKLDKTNKTNRSFGLKALRNSTPLNFAKDVNGISSATKRYILSIRSITENWKGRKNDILITIRQQEKEAHTDIKALGIRIPISDIENIRTLTKEILSLLYVACELKSVQINDILREILSDINVNGSKMVSEIKKKMIFQS